MIRAGQAIFLGAVLLAALLGQTQAQTKAIYSCVDSKGRRLSADRPIPECVDREQKLLGPSGTVKATVGPTLTAHERAELERRQNLEAEERARQAEAKRHERALLARYPSQDTHDQKRAEVLAQIGAARQAAATRVSALLRQRDKLAIELEFYQKDPSKIPSSLRWQRDDIAHGLAAQEHLIADQDAERDRVNAQFDEELQRLKLLWAKRAPKAAATAAK